MKTYLFPLEMRAFHISGEEYRQESQKGTCWHTWRKTQKKSL